MTRFKLSEIYLGINDGKKESLYRNDFEKFFINHDNMKLEILKPNNFIILGRKGSGKTILAHYIKKIAQSDSNWFCDVTSYKDFRFHELMQLKSNDVSPNEYSAIWRWIILIDLGKRMLNDLGIDDIESKNKLATFFKENYYSVNIDAKKVVEITKENRINGSILKTIGGIGGERGVLSKVEETNYLAYLEDLESVIVQLLKKSKSKYTIFYDELDDRFKNTKFYTNSLISLIKTTDSLNLIFLENGLDVKVVLLIRTDIFSLLNDTDLNKIKRINTLKIDWGRRVNPNSPLIQLVVEKAKISNEYLNKMPDHIVFKKLFPQSIKGVRPERFILERTFFRPRDVITILNLIIDRYPNSTYFGWKGFLEVKSDYSEYFMDEIRNEMAGHLETKEIDQGITLLKNYNHHFFSYKEIEKYFKSQSSHYEAIDLQKILKQFFKFNIVGNRWYNTFKKRQYYTWSHRDERAEIDFNKDIIVHLGLREELSM